MPVPAVPRPAGANNAAQIGLLVTTSIINVRNAPTKDAIIVVAALQDAAIKRYAEGETNADTYLWSWVEVVNTDGNAYEGWMALVHDSWDQQIASSAPVTFQPVDVDLPIDLVTQNNPPPGEWNLCAEACLAMLAHFKAAKINDPVAYPYGTLTAAQAAKYVPGRQPGAETSYTQIEEGGERLGLTLVPQRPTAAEMVAELNAGRPFMVDIIRSSIPQARAIYAQHLDDSHLIVVGGAGKMSDGSNYFVIYDPLGFPDKIGDALKVRESDLIGGMKATGFPTTALFLRADSLDGGNAAAALLAQAEAALDVAAFQQIAYAITRRFEGSGYAAISALPNDKFSYGWIQFTGNSLGNVLQAYADRGGLQGAALADYIARVRAADESLKTDHGFFDLLTTASDDPIMRAVQDEQAASRYWKPMFDNDVSKRGLTLPFAYAFGFDCSVEHGPKNSLWKDTETALRLPELSTKAERDALNMSEIDFLKAVAKTRLDRFGPWADQRGFPGVRRRVQWWVNQAAAGNFALQNVP